MSRVCQFVRFGHYESFTFLSSLLQNSNIKYPSFKLLENAERLRIMITILSIKWCRRRSSHRQCVRALYNVIWTFSPTTTIKQNKQKKQNTSPTANYPFNVDTFVSSDSGKLLVDVHRKPTHTDRYLDFHSHHERKHKISTAETLLHRALNLSNTQVGKTRETVRVCAALHSNGYPIKIAAGVIRKKARPPPLTSTPEGLVGMFFKWAEPKSRRSFAVLPYIKGIMEPLTRIRKEHDIQVTSRPVRTLQQHLPIHLPSFDLPKTSSAMSSIKFRAHLAPGTTSARLKDPLLLGEKNTWGT